MKKESKLLSLVLRHKPEAIGITLDDEGWVNISVLLKALKYHKGSIWNKTLLNNIVDNNDKQRFYIDTSGSKIRASQGHSVKVNIKYKEVTPTSDLYHGTISKVLDSIFKDGLSKMKRTHVHLSSDIETAIKVGARRGKPVILTIDAQKMYNDGVKFYISENGVWLTDHISPKYISRRVFW